MKTDEDVILVYANKKQDKLPNKMKLTYDIVLLVVILLDLMVMLFNQIIISDSFAIFAPYLGVVAWLDHYQKTLFLDISKMASFFTAFLIGELLVRWGIAIVNKTYYRWFFFPFVHWYEVLGCFPSLRPLRLLRAVIIVKRLHDIGVQVIPNRWLKTGQFYGHMLLEELSDRVILTAVDNFRIQMRKSNAHPNLIEQTLSNNRQALEHVLVSLLQHEIVPILQHELKSQMNHQLAKNVSLAVAKALHDTPELRRILRLIPIAGAMIEEQVADIGRSIAHNVVIAVNEQVLSDELLNALMANIAHGIAHLDANDEHLQKLVVNLTNDALNAFEAQIKIQQGKHKEHLSL